MCHVENAAGPFCASCGWKLEAATPQTLAAGQGALASGDREAEAYLSLQSSEAAVLAAASRIYAAHIVADHVTSENEADLATNSVTMAMRMAIMTDRRLQSDDEEG
jgi:hypothetical protein